MVRSILIALAVAVVASPVLAHTGHAGVRQIRFPTNRPEAVWLVVQNVGLLVPDGDDFRWLCDEAITTKPGFNDLVPLDADGLIWAAATRFGLFRTLDAGCTFEPIDGVLARHQIGAISPHPGVSGEAIAFTETTTLSDDVFWTTDSGETWTAAGLDLLWPIHSLIRSKADPLRIYAIHREGAVRSDDGGRSFQAIAYVPDGDEAGAKDVRVLATHPANADLVYGVIDRLPTPDFIRSEDGGVSWVSVTTLDEIPDTLIISADGDAMLLSLPFAGLRRSDDGGQTWQPKALMEPNQSATCMFAGPDGAVWVCALGGSQFIIRTDDFGETWQPVFARDFLQVRSGWACAEETKTALACAVACDRSVEDCGEAMTPSGDDGGTSMGEGDSTPSTAPEDGGMGDALVNPMDAITADLSVTGVAQSTEDGCQGAPFETPLGLVGLFLVVLRRKPRPWGRGHRERT